MSRRRTLIGAVAAGAGLALAASAAAAGSGFFIASVDRAAAKGDRQVRDAEGRTLSLSAADVLTPADVRGVAVERDPANGRPLVVLRLTPAGTRRFALYARTHLGEHIAFVLDGRVLASPVIAARLPEPRVVIYNPQLTAKDADRIAGDIRKLVPARGR